MRKFILLYINILFCVLACEPVYPGRAVNNLNAEIAAHYKHYDHGDGYQVGARFNLPVGQYFGTSLGAAVYDVQADDGYADAAGYSGRLSLFLGSRNVGRIGGEYRVRERDLEHDYRSGDVRVESERVGLFSEYYAGLVSVGYRISDIEEKVKSDEIEFLDSDRERSALFMNVYPVDNLRIEVAEYGKDFEGRTDLGIEYQTSRLMSLYAEYWNDGGSTPGEDIFLIGLTFHFARGETLIDNDRHY